MEEKTDNPLKNYCPMIFNIKIAGRPVGCYEKDCAWWDFNTGNCAVLAIAKFGSKGTQEILKEEIRDGLDKEF